MARRLVDMGHEVNLITSSRLRSSPNCCVQTIESGINVFWLPVPYSHCMGFKDRLFAFLKFAYLSTKLSCTIPSDIIFASSTPLTICIPGIISSLYRKVPMVFEVRDLWPEMPIAMGILKILFLFLQLGLESLAYKYSASVVALSPGMKAGVVGRGFPSERVAVIPNACDFDKFTSDTINLKEFRAKRPWLCDQPLFVYAGTFGRVNSVSYAVSLAIELLAIGSNVRILLVGDGFDSDHLHNMANTSNVLNNNLFIEPRMSKNDIVSLFSAATIASNLVIDLPQARANSANKFFDSLAAGKPIFLNHGGWMHDLVVKYECGIAAWGMPIDRVAQLLDEKLNDCDWLDNAGSSAMTLALKYFDRDALASQLDRVLHASTHNCPESAESIAPGIFHS